MNNFTVYCHKNMTNGMCYVGITSESVYRRWQNGRNYSGTFKKAIDQYGWDNFEHIIIATDLNRDEACAMEQSLVHQYKEKGISYNEKDGGDHHFLNDKVKEEMSKRQKGTNAYWFGKKMPDETRELMSARKKGITPKANPKKLVRCLETGEVFDSLTSCARHFSVSLATVSNSCNKKQGKPRKDRLPYTFEFV